MSRLIVVLSVIFGISVIYAWLFLDARQIVENYQALKSIVANHYWLALIGFFVIYSLMVALSLPVAASMTLFGAALFGWLALPVIVLASSLGALCIFSLAKTLFRSKLKSRVDQYLSGARNVFQKSPIRWCFTMRLIPFVPFWAANILPAILGMAWMPFFIATLIGIIPGSTIYVGLGVGLDTIFSRGENVTVSLFWDPYLWVPLTALGISSALSTCFKSKFNKEK